ncbi:MAG TPA: lytic transglycosylase domain-containing protein [Aggregatilinea sp.]|uniref:lytic transglycosylase domain-containing protein n=1 Tax=Aggregatilinea sp. TaxID=2806333 RepID=UPI002C6E3FCE|nr:lytic transglycosylase domain-containing protein [Aggregatilinea sp.]HML20146.1 lytic transglycosylase domain-containing protein [Aggregatilinea sp.]
MATQTYERSTTSFTAAIQERIEALIAAFVLLLCGAIGFAGTLGTAKLVTSVNAGTITFEVIEPQIPAYSMVAMGEEAALSPLSPAFTPQVQYWAPLINAWAILYQMDPNLIATVIQIESCGDPSVGSNAGAQGLFQVMPFHFAPGEDMLDVQTNAARGLSYLAEGLAKANGHVGLALAGYNGGHGVIDRGWATWPAETQRYYYWGSRIYSEATSGLDTSATLQEWLNAGGSVLCTRAQATEDQLTQHQAGF